MAEYKLSGKFVFQGSNGRNTVLEVPKNEPLNVSQLVFNEIWNGLQQQNEILAAAPPVPPAQEQPQQAPLPVPQPHVNDGLQEAFEGQGQPADTQNQGFAVQYS